MSQDPQVLERHAARAQFVEQTEQEGAPIVFGREEGSQASIMTKLGQARSQGDLA